ncbi:DUF1513 domain-containing protein [Marinicellulosiphila megalodicopiae]|uniref:DUF1513 domain-containing protein n=1 Tax=Marinicellulosiphila megalodicopiae TaxID=2724896 RepID=UPI003BB0D6FB
MNKRDFIQFSFLSSVFIQTGCFNHSTQNKTMRLIGSGKVNGGWVLSAVDTEGNPIFQHALPSRAHHISKNIDQSKGLVIARRPGNYARLFESKTGQTIKEISAPDGHFYFGHSCFTSNEIFICTGNSKSLGKISVYDLDLNFKYFIELNNFGPHQIEALDDNTIAIAVGGLKTIDRKILNLDDFNSEVIIVDTLDKKIIHSYKIDNQNLSLRHLHVFNNQLVVAAQIPDREYLFDDLTTPLIYVLNNKKLEPLKHPNWNAFNQYIASISFNDNQLVATSPKGNTLSIWNYIDNQFKFSEQLEFIDVAGVTQFEQQSFWSTGTGVIASQINKTIKIKQTKIHWDNHWNAFYD